MKGDGYKRTLKLYKQVDLRLCFVIIVASVCHIMTGRSVCVVQVNVLFLQERCCVRVCFKDFYTYFYF